MSVNSLQTDRRRERETDSSAPCVCGCRCPSWSDDEQICVRSVNNELHFYENNDFSKKQLSCELT